MHYELNGNNIETEIFGSEYRKQEFDKNRLKWFRCIQIQSVVYKVYKGD